MTIEESLNLAMQKHQAGRLDEAQTLYRQILAQQPNQPEALHGLGVVLRQQGRREEAVDLIGRAIAIRPRVARFHANLGAILDELGRTDEAIAAYERAIAIRPNHAGALSNLGRALTHKGRLPEAIAACRQAIAFEPNMAEAHQNLGGALFQAQAFVEAAESLGQAVALRPDSAAMHNELGAALLEIRRLEESVAALRRAIALVPNFAEAHNNLGAALLEMGKTEEAIGEFSYAVIVSPNFVDAYNNLGNALRWRGELDKSVEVLNQAIGAKPDSVELLTSLGCAHFARGEYERAVILYRAALGLKPRHVTANWNLGLSLLLQGDLEHGWPLYEWRWKLKEFRGRTYPKQPLWDGGNLNGRRILLHAEQGFGDAIQFVRYLPAVARHGGQIILACHAELHRLFKEMDQPVKQWVAPDQALPDCDVHCPLMSLPMVLNVTASNLGSPTPYLKAGVNARNKWAKRLEGNEKFKVGLVWAGRPTHANDRDRSMALADLARLGEVEGIEWISLQKGEAAKQIEGAALPVVDWTRELEDFADTAGLIAHLDLVICVDTAVAHLAGAMGKAAWVLLPFVPDWRWMLKRGDSPWYPTMRLFRQERIGDWGRVIGQVAAALGELRAGKA